MVVGVEIGSSSILAVAVNAEGVVARRARHEGATKAAAVADVVRAVVQGAAQRIGVAGRARGAHADLAATAAQAAGLEDPALVTTGSAIALGEQWAGAARGAAHVVSLTIDDHVHGGIVINGHPFNGAHGLAGDAPWFALNPVERDDYRRLGCLEAEISASGIARRLVWRVKTGDPSLAQDLAGGELNAVTLAHVLDAARQDDGVAVSVVRDTARYVGMAVANLVAIVDPEVVVLGGVIASAGDLLVAPAHAEAVRRMSPSTTPRVVAGVLREDAAAIGAARAAMLRG